MSEGCLNDGEEPTTLRAGEDFQVQGVDKKDKASRLFGSLASVATTTSRAPVLAL